jgi:starch phosphorylase
VPLLLLDTDVPKNHPADRPITGLLYVAGREMRLAQELVLGVGGMRALEALGIEPAVWHLNEGHCALVQLERLRRAVAKGRKAERALADLGKQVVFTTHTPVPAGNETFDRELAGKYLGPWSELTGLPTERLLELGEAGPAAPEGDGFNLTALGLRTSRAANAVSRVNAEVVQRMWAHLRPPEDRAHPPIFPITNGVHAGTWAGREMRDLFSRHLGADWQEKLLEEEAWRPILAVPDEELWAAHRAQKERLGRFTRTLLRDQFARHGRSPDELRAVDELFDPAALTLGFARRFATYKRAKLVFTDLTRLRGLLCQAERPIQLLFAGKAHPADLPGQDLIRQIFELSQSSDLGGRVFFLEDYDMRVGRMLVQGADVWLNTPRRPMEASGTSGQKAALNGALNLSVLDGWWPEGYEGDNGWAIEGAVGTEEEQDQADAAALYALLEGEVVPLFYERDAVGLPGTWIARMKRSIASITPRLSSHRMVREYVDRAYFPVE